MVLLSTPAEYSNKQIKQAQQRVCSARGALHIGSGELAPQLTVNWHLWGDLDSPLWMETGSKSPQGWKAALRPQSGGVASPGWSLEGPLCSPHCFSCWIVSSEQWPRS